MRVAVGMAGLGFVMGVVVGIGMAEVDLVLRRDSGRGRSSETAARNRTWSCRPR